MGTGPLKGLRVIEIAGIGPGPFAAMLLADLGAEVLRIERKEGVAIMRQMGFDPARDASNRSRHALAVDLKDPAAIALVLDLIAGADALIEGFRPGVMERLGLGPEVCLARNPRLVYGRMTGWGQTGPLARAAGHDINYIALSGMLYTFTREGQPPVPPGNTVGDMGGGGLLLAFGILCALHEARASALGQIVDAAMFEGAAALGTSVFVTMAMGLYDASRPGTNLSDTGAHFYEVYETRDAKHVAVGAIEPQFYAELLRGLGLDASTLPKQMDRRSWPEMKRRFAELFRDKTRAEWDEVFAGKDACVSPVLTPVEAAVHPHARERASFCSPAGVLQPSPVPRFSRTPGGIAGAPALPSEESDATLESWGIPAVRIAELRSSGVML
jgi:alpha-methylacyl-CoA racemase